MKNINQLLVSIIFLISFSIFLPYSHAATKKTVYATHDSYLSSYDRENNYGEQTSLYCGTWGTYDIYEYEVYMYFDLRSIKLGWNKVNLYLDFFLVSQIIHFDILRITGRWSEFLITWNNKPAHGMQLLSFLIADNGLYYIDVSSHVSGTVFSICICTSYDQYAWISSREVYYASISSREVSWENSRPKLVFEYETNYVDLILGLIGTIIAIAVIGVAVYVLFTQQKKKKRMQ